MARGVEFLKEGGRNILRCKGDHLRQEEGRGGEEGGPLHRGLHRRGDRLITGKKYIVEEVRCFSDGEKDCDLWVKPFGLTAGA